MKQVIIINGSGGAGKDTFCDYVSRYSGYGTYTISSVDKVKEIARIIGWDGSKTEKDRKFLSDLKLLTTEYNDMPLKYIKEKIEYFKNNSSLEIMFIHIREPKEIDKLKREYQDENIKTLLITNKNVPNITSNNADAGVFDYSYDYIIRNDDTLYDLKVAALRFVLRLVETCVNTKRR